jgi:hypothetical protein
VAGELNDGPRTGVARYFFHLCEGQDTLIDPEGREIGDVTLIPHGDQGGSGDYSRRRVCAGEPD